MQLGDTCVPVLVWYSLRGLTELLLGALLLLALTCLVHAAGRPRTVLAAGALMGLVVLDRIGVNLMHFV